MQLNMQLVITNPVEFLRGDYSTCLTLYDHETTVEGWINCGWIAVEINATTEQIFGAAVSDLDEKIAMLKKAVTVLESRKSELRALTYQAEA